MADEFDPGSDDPFIRAGEYVLGVLEGSELAEASRTLLSDTEFANAVAWWEWRLGAMAEAVGQFAPSPNVWNGIEARLDADAGDHTPSPLSERTRTASKWSIAAFAAGLGMAAASVAIFLSVPQQAPIVSPTAAPTSESQLIAQLQDEETGRRLAGVIDTSSGRLALSITGLEADVGKTPELWVIPAGGAPVSLGAIPQAGKFEREISSSERGLLQSGATLAVTFEDDTGVRHDAPTMPILLVGTLDQV